MNKQYRIPFPFGDRLKKWGRRLGGLCCIGMLLLLVSCLKSTPVNTDPPVPLREKVRFPGQDFDHVVFGYKTSLFAGQDYPQFFSQNIRTGNSFPLVSDDMPLGRPVQLIPGHQADLMVSLSLQDVYLPRPSKCIVNSGEEFAFLFVDEASQILAWLEYLEGCLLLKTNTGNNILLTKKGMARLDRIVSEVKLRY